MFGYSLENTAIQYHNCMLEDMVVEQIALTLSVQMVKTDSVTGVISVISVWQVGIGWIQTREFSNSASYQHQLIGSKCEKSKRINSVQLNFSSFLTNFKRVSQHLISTGSIHYSEDLFLDCCAIVLDCYSPNGNVESLFPSVIFLSV